MAVRYDQAVLERSEVRHMTCEDAVMVTEPHRLVAALLPELIACGARAIALAGSRVGGRATRYSDLDVIAVGPRDLDGYSRAVDGVLVVVASMPEETHRADFRDPAYLSWVPTWRSAQIVHDPEAVAVALQREAAAWTWDVVGDERCDRWVAAQITGYAEEVHKLASGVELRDPTLAAVQRSVLALRLPAVMAVHRRLLYESENELWSRICVEFGSAWRGAFEAALILPDRDPSESSAAALTLYRLAAAHARDVLDDDQRAVVDLALHVGEETTARLHAGDGS